jgi:DNA polymerase-3 subunit gamma/tau
MLSELTQTQFSLEEVLGQPIAIRYLKNYTKSPEKIPPLLIFHGPSGVGKYFTALRFIKTILCFQNTGCGICPSCRSFAKQTHPDLIVFPDQERVAIGEAKDPKEFTIRWLQSQRLIYTPSLSKVRFVVFPDATKINSEAETALLKTLEESPYHTRFIFLVEDLQLLKSTIRSRAVLIPFQYLALSYVKEIANKQNIFLNDPQSGSLDLNLLPPEVYDEYKNKVQESIFDAIQLLNLEIWIKDHKTNHPEWTSDFDYGTFLEIITSMMIYEYRSNQSKDFTEAILAIFEFKEILHQGINSMEPFLLGRLFQRLGSLIP